MMYFCDILKIGKEEQKMKKTDTQYGRSMVEMMGYMMVVLSVVVAVGKLVTNAFEEHRYSVGSTQLSELVGTIVKAAAVDPDYSEVVKMINQDASLAGNRLQEGSNMIPRSFRRVGNTLYHVFGGKVKISTYAPDKFAIVFENLRKKQCVEMGLKDWRKNQYADLYAVYINDKYKWYWPAYGNDSGGVSGEVTNIFPITRAKLTGVGGNASGISDDDKNGQCADNSNNKIMWIFN